MFGIAVKSCSEHLFMLGLSSKMCEIFLGQFRLASSINIGRIMRLPGPVKDTEQNITEPGDMLAFVAGFPPVYGKQILYFLDKTFSERSKIDTPEKSDTLLS